MNTKFITLCAALALGFTLNIANADSSHDLYAVDALYAADDDASIAQIGSEHKAQGSSLSALELHEADDEVIYADDDLSIVLTGAR